MKSKKIEFSSKLKRFDIEKSDIDNKKFDSETKNEQFN